MVLHIRVDHVINFRIQIQKPEKQNMGGRAKGYTGAGGCALCVCERERERERERIHIQN